MTAHCHKCGKDTETIYQQLSSGHIGNCCAVCGILRLGNPYITKRKLAKLIQLKLIPPIGTPHEGERHDTAIY